MHSSYFTLFFISFIVIQFAVRTWLNMRQIRYVSKHATTVPEQFSEKINLKSHQKAAKYTLENIRLSQINMIIETIVLLGFTILGGLNYIVYSLAEFIPNGLWQGLVLFFIVQLISALVSLPSSIYKTFKLEQKYGFNRMTAKLFIKDTITGALVSLILGGLLLTIILTLMAISEQWWLWTWLACVIFAAIMMYIAPVWLMPLFNKFTPLEDEELKNKINALAKRCDFSLSGLFVMDGSKRSSHGNAFFTGFGKNRRIVFFDTLLKRLNSDEIEAVMAHELGHFKHKHIIKRMFIMLIVSFLFFALLGYVADQFWFYEGLSVLPSAVINMHALALILFMMVLPVFTFWLSPLNSYLSRKDEFEADYFATQYSQTQHLISALVKLYKDNASTLTPDPIYSAYYDSHPPAVIRVQHLQAYL